MITCLVNHAVLGRRAQKAVPKHCQWPGQVLIAQCHISDGPDRVEFKANRVFLALISDALQAMLFGQMQEAQRDSEVIIDDIDPNGFQSVLNFAYCKDPAITIDNVVAVKCICRKYRISDLSVLCDQYYDSCIDSTTICSLLTEAVTFKLNEFVQKCQEKVAGNLGTEAADIVQSDGFMKMNQTSMCQLLQSDDLLIAEEALWDAVVKWSSNQSNESSNRACDAGPPAKRRKLENEKTDSRDVQISFLRSVAPHIRFGLMDAAYFIENVQPTGCLSDAEMLTITNYFIMSCKDPGYRCVKMDVKERRRNVICIERGVVGNTDICSWGYDDDATDAICITTNQNCYLEGIGLFDCEGSLEAGCAVYVGDNHSSGCIVFAMESKRFAFKERTDTPFELRFDKKVLIKKDTKYTIEINQVNLDGFASNHVMKALQSVTADGLTVTFNDAINSPNLTDSTHGAFPCLYFSI